jgi:hypothetical protein
MQKEMDNLNRQENERADHHHLFYNKLKTPKTGIAI